MQYLFKCHILVLQSCGMGYTSNIAKGTSGMDQWVDTINGRYLIASKFSQQVAPIASSFVRWSRRKNVVRVFVAC